MGRKKSFEEYFIKSGTMYIGDAIPTPKYRRPVPPPPPISKEILTSISAFDYESPIKIIQDAMQMQVENDVYKAIQNYDIKVDKDELIKALKYDREQYKKGFRDGVRKFAEKLKEEMHKRDMIWDLCSAIDIFAEKLVGDMQ